MGLVSTGFWVSIEFCDNGNNRSTRTYQMTSADAAAAASDTTDILAAFNGVTDAVISSYFTYERFVESALAYPASGVELQNQALMDFDIVGHPEKSATVTIPAPKPSIFVATSGAGANIIDTSDAAVIAWRDLFRTAGQLLVSDGEVANSLISGKRIHRKSNFG